MLERIDSKILVTPEDIIPSTPGYKVIGAFNPAAVRFGDEVCLLVRIAEAPEKIKEGYISSPRAVFNNGKTIVETDRFPVKTEGSDDVRQFTDLSRLARLPFISHIRLVKLDKSGFRVNYIDKEPTFFPSDDTEEFGVEDPRMTDIEGRFYLTYVAVSRKMGVCTKLASTFDFVNYFRHGVIFCRENKDVVLLPEKVGGKYAAYHRPVGRSHFDKPSMVIAYSLDLIHWGEHASLLRTRDDCWDEVRMGAGPPPIRTKEGWLEIYHGVQRRKDGNPVGIYSAGAALFDLKDPGKLIARSKDPILSPTQAHEAKGFVDNVIFPTGIITDETGEHIILYSGGADSVVTATKLRLKDVMDALR